MKKLFAILLFIVTGFATGEILRGFPLSVTLVSGTSQQAEYLGSAGDTLFLGGFIADTFTVVKLQRERILSLKDSAGNILTFAEADSLLQNFRATTSLSAVEPKNDLDLSEKALVFPVFSRSIDSALAERIYDLEFQLLKESGDRVLKVSAKDFPECKDSPCIANEAEKRGATAVWTAEIKPAKHQDSLDIHLHRFLFETKFQSSERLTVSSKHATGELLAKDRFLSLMQKIKGTYQEPPAKKDTKSFIFVETYPEGANLSRKGEDVICQTPCAFAVVDTGKVELEAFWNVEKTLWANKATVRPIPGDTTKINMHLKRVKPEVEIRTVPSGAKIFSETEITPSSRPIGKTPKTLFSEEPGLASIHLWKEGFRDSVVEFYVNATTRTQLEIQLSPIATDEERKAQAVFETVQKRIFWGHLALGTAIAPAIAGGILLYIAEKDRDKAKSIKKELDMPSSGGGKNFQTLLDRNHRYADRAKTERYVGTGFLILAGGLLATGIILSF